MFDFIVDWLMELALSIVEMFPVADVDGIAAAFEPLGRAISWVSQLNEFLPIVEALALFGVVISVVVALYVVMFARRLFSLVWPGAGS